MSAPQPTGSVLTREAILRALSSLSEELVRRGVTGEICLFGGTSCCSLSPPGAALSFDFDAAWRLLDEFYAAPRAAAPAEVPALLAPQFGDIGCGQDAYLAATAEELARRLSVFPPLAALRTALLPEKSPSLPPPQPVRQRERPHPRLR